MGEEEASGQISATAEANPTTRATSETINAMRLSLLAIRLESSLTLMDKAILTVSHVPGNSDVLKCAYACDLLRAATNRSNSCRGNEKTDPLLILC